MTTDDTEDRGWTAIMVAAFFIFALAAMAVGGYCDHHYDPRNSQTEDHK